MLINNINNDEPGKSYWKLNMSVLTDNDYQEKIKTVVSDCESLKTAFPNTCIAEWWMM